MKRRRAIKIEKVELNPASVQYANMTDKEAKAKVDNIKQQIKDLRALEGLSKDPVNVARLRELYTTLAWHKANKNRSKYFDMISVGASTRYARRHPVKIRGGKAVSLKDSLPNDTRPKLRTKNRQKREKLPLLKSAFARMFGKSKSGK